MENETMINGLKSQLSFLSPLDPYDLNPEKKLTDIEVPGGGN